MDPIHVIVRPIVTEKATWGSGHQNRFAFEVSKLATKTDIKKAVESLYKVRVLGVATQTRRLRNRAYAYGFVAGKTWKRAVVKIHPEDKIELF
ncbi:MAG: 50S ribosomal protein L23 [Limnohabitans sp.]|jgi:large subunit ribosomal protein L23|nr:50S ribosomal protein L23 [Limnohabitans sp.]